MKKNSLTVLGIESSCDDTSAAIIQDTYLLTSLIANQDIHRQYGGVVPELASRAHQQNIIPVVDQAIQKAGIQPHDIDALAFTRGPGLLGSLMVGTSFAKGMSMALGVPLLQVNHLQGHILSHFILEKNKPKNVPGFPFLCLLVSGGHTQLVVVHDYLKMEIIGQTIDDASGEAFDKCAKMMGFPYPGGPLVDKHAKQGNPLAFEFSKPNIPGYDYSFSGLKTSFLYFLRDQVKKNKNFVEENLDNLCASLQKTIIDILLHKLLKASQKKGIKKIALAGGVAANSGLRGAIKETAKTRNWEIYLPELKFTTDNAAMIAITGYYQYLDEQFAELSVEPKARLKF